MRAVGTTTALTPPGVHEFSGNPTPVLWNGTSIAPTYSVSWAPALISSTPLSPAASWAPGVTTATVALHFDRYYIPTHPLVSGTNAYAQVQVPGTATDPATGVVTVKTFNLRDDNTQQADGSGIVTYSGTVPYDFPANAAITAVFQPTHSGGVARMRHPSGSQAVADYPTVEIPTPSIVVSEVRPQITRIDGLSNLDFTEVNIGTVMVRMTFDQTVTWSAGPNPYLLLQGTTLDGRQVTVKANIMASHLRAPGTTFTLLLDWTAFPELLHAPNGLTVEAFVVPSATTFVNTVGALSIDPSVAGVQTASLRRISNRRFSWFTPLGSGTTLRATADSLGLHYAQPAGMTNATARAHRITGPVGATAADATYTEVEVTGQIEQMRFLLGSTSAVATPSPFNNPALTATRTVGVLVRPFGTTNGCAFISVDGAWQRGAGPATATNCTLGYPVTLSTRNFEIQMAKAEGTLRHRPFAAAPSGAEGQMYGPPVVARTWGGF